MQDIIIDGNNWKSKPKTVSGGMELLMANVMPVLMSCILHDINTLPVTPDYHYVSI